MDPTPTTLQVAVPAPARPLLRGWSHLVAFASTLAVTPLLLAQARPGGRALLAVYATSLAVLFGVSALYHRTLWQPRARAVMRRLDHATIFVLIAGSYTAVAGLSLPWTQARTTLLVVWAGAAAGIVLQVFVPHLRTLAAATYLALGWAAVGVMGELRAALTTAEFSLLVAGGLLYTIGALAYASKRPRLAPQVFGYHEVFHALVIAAAVCHTLLVTSLAG